MTNYQKWSLFLLRLALGWLFFYAGISKIMTGNWSAGGYLNHAVMFQGFYHWLGSSSMVGLVSLVSEWGMLLLGASLILGVWVRYSAVCGAILMLLYYFPILNFPHPNVNSYIVDEHIVYALALLVLAASQAGRIMGLEDWISKRRS